MPYFILLAALFATLIIPHQTLAYNFTDVSGTAQSVWQSTGGSNYSFQGNIVFERAYTQDEINWSLPAPSCNAAATQAGLSSSGNIWCAVHADYTVSTCVTSTGAPCPSGGTSGGGESAGDYYFSYGYYTYRTYLTTTPPNTGSGTTKTCAVTTPDVYGYGSYCSSYRQTGAAPTVTLTANPTTIVRGNASSVTLSSTNADSCSGNFNSGSATSGVYSVSPTDTTTYTATCTNASGSASASATVTVIVLPDLTVDTPQSRTGTAGQVISLSGTIRNIGTGATGAGFQNTMWVDRQNADSTWTAVWSTRVDTASALAVNGTDVRSANYTPPSAGTYRYTICADSGTTITESNEGNNCGTHGILTVTTAPQADLVPTNIVPRTVVAGVSNTYTGTVQNTGGAATPNFASTVYVCPENDTACQNAVLAAHAPSLPARIASIFSTVVRAATADTISMSTISVAANGTGTQTGTKTFNTPGRYSMAYCADIPGDTVSESNNTKANNCGTWQLLVICPSGNTIDGSGNCVSGPTALSCTVTPTTVPDAGGSVTYTAQDGSGSTYTWTPTGGGTLSGSGATRTRTFAGTDPSGNYSMTVQRGTETATCPVIVKNPGACVGTDTGTLTASPDRIRANTETSITFNYTAQNISGICRIQGPDYDSGDITASACVVGPGTRTGSISIPTQSTYTLTCDGTVVDEAIINVIPAVIEF